MYSKSDLIKAFHNDFQILKHLYGKVEEQHLEHKFTDKQRTIKELLQYLANGSLLTARIIAAGGKSTMTSEEYTTTLASTDVSKFPELIDQEDKEVAKIIEALSDAELQEEITLWGMFTATRAVHLVDLRAQLVAYKMQFFLQLKHAGVHNIGTSNVWGGMDTPTS